MSHKQGSLIWHKNDPTDKVSRYQEGGGQSRGGGQRMDKVSRYQEGREREREGR